MTLPTQEGGEKMETALVSLMIIALILTLPVQARLETMKGKVSAALHTSPQESDGDAKPDSQSMTSESEYGKWIWGIIILRIFLLVSTVALLLPSR